MAPTSGLLIAGNLIPVLGLTIVPPGSCGGPSWCSLNRGDFMPRSSPVSIIAIHTTGGHWPQPVVPGAGPTGHARQILEMWSGADHGGGDREHSAAPLVVDFDGTVYCAGDLTRDAAYHAQAINDRALGIEMCTRPDGAIYQSTLDATARLVAMLTWSGLPGSGILSIPAQIPRGPYAGAPLRRLELDGHQTSGRGLVGVIGHRDQTARRGRGDPGDAIFAALDHLGFERPDYDAGQDLDLGRARQGALNALGERLVVDGVVGPASLAAARRRGFSRWRDVPVTA